ncbi:exit protein of rhodopsin and TRP A [Cochliomyia hominivorax]
MKAKQGAFTNSATGYGKRHSSKANKSNNFNNNKSAKTSESRESVNKKYKKVEKELEKPKTEEEQEDDLNSGFGNYLRSHEGVEMMKIFVFANTVMVIITIAWPHFKEQYIWFMEWLDSFKQESY